MTENYKYFSQIQKYEIININDGEKYSYLSNNDIVIDENGYLRFLILNESKSKFAMLNNNTFIEVPWKYVKKIGAKTIIIDFEEKNMKKTKF